MKLICQTKQKQNKQKNPQHQNQKQQEKTKSQDQAQINKEEGELLPHNMIHNRKYSGQRDGYIRQYEILKKGTWNIFLFNVGYVRRNRHGESDISMKLNSILYSGR